MPDGDSVQAPDLPKELDPAEPADGEVDLSAALVTGGSVNATRIRISESELKGLVIESDHAPGLTLIDVLMRDCGLSNLDAREGMIKRVEVRTSRLVGFALTGGEVHDLRVVDSSLELASFAGSRLRNVTFERVNLNEATFLEAGLEAVRFLDCELDGTDFRGARLSDCEIRGSSLSEVLGVASLRGVRMPWSDVVSSAGALAVALGIQIEDG
jgi:uncharacterized protein YjbI with pentapeptide repeats